MSGVVDQGTRPTTVSVDARDPAIRYSPEGWIFNQDSSVSHRPGSSVTLQFIGSRVRWVGTADPETATYMVDDAVSKSFPDSGPSSSATPRTLFETPYLPFGSHNLTAVLHREGSSLSLSYLVIQNGSTTIESQLGVAGSLDDMQPLYRRDPPSEDRMSTTAVLAGVFGSFGFFLLVGAIFLFIRRRRMQKTRRSPRRKTEAKQGIAIEEFPSSSRRAVSSPPSPPRASHRPKERRETKSPNRARQREPTSQSLRPVEASSPSKPTEPRHRRQQTSQRPPRSPETPTTPGKDVDPHSQPLIPPSPQRFKDSDTQEEPRAETPVPLHPPLRFSPAPRPASPANILPPSASRRQERRHISGMMGDSDTEYMSDASVNSRATRQTLMSTIGASRRAGSLQAVPPARSQPQQQVVLDLPPAYTPE